MTKETIIVTFQPMNKVLTVPAGTPLLDAMRTAGIAIEAICGGQGLCRKCRVILTNGKCTTTSQLGASHFTPEEIAQGYHYACQVTLTANAGFTIPVESRIVLPQILITSKMNITTISPAVVNYPVEVSPSEGLPFASQSIRLAGYSGPRPRTCEQVYRRLNTTTGPLIATISHVFTPPKIIAVEPAASARPLYGIAIDLGTTTVVGCLVNLETGEIVETGSTMNRQITYGEELITRIGFADSPEGLATMQKAARESIDTVITQISDAAGIGKTDIVDICVAGNTVMHHLFCGIEPHYLEMANAQIPRTPLIKNAHELGLCLHPDAQVYCLPNVSRFVGGDAIGDVIASGMHASEELSLLIDLGTNGEIILGNKDWTASVSCASGPAFEGGGMTCGMRAMNGAIEHVRFDSETAETICSTIGNVPPRGICGSGIIDAAVAMVASNALDFAGKLNPRHPRVRNGSEGLEYVLIPASASATGRDMVFTQQDVDYLMDSKAAACGAIGVLMGKYKIAVTDIRHIYLSGAFGTYTDIGNTVRFGILPEFPNATFHPLGNGSLSGAYATLVSREYRIVAEKVARHMVYIDLLVDNDFMEEYSAALYIPGKHELFPNHYKENKNGC
jgi:uncharacterized 2Fe-2S/4Fe-4S cluster protein (DUF4445 family)